MSTALLRMHEAFALLTADHARLAELGTLPQFREDRARTRPNIFDATQQAGTGRRLKAKGLEGVRNVAARQPSSSVLSA